MSYVPESLRGKPLSPSEIEILGAIAYGFTDSQIGTRLCMAEGTVRTHVRRMLVKLDARSRAHMVTAGFIQGYLRLPPQALQAQPLKAVA